MRSKIGQMYARVIGEGNLGYAALVPKEQRDPGKRKKYIDRIFEEIESSYWTPLGATFDRHWEGVNAMDNEFENDVAIVTPEEVRPYIDAERTRFDKNRYGTANTELQGAYMPSDAAEVPKYYKEVFRGNAIEDLRDTVSVFGAKNANRSTWAHEFSHRYYDKNPSERPEDFTEERAVRIGLAKHALNAFGRKSGNWKEAVEHFKKFISGGKYGGKPQYVTFDEAEDILLKEIETEDLYGVDR